MRVLLVKYNKVTNHAIQNISSYISSRADILYADVFKFGSRADILSYSDISTYFASIKSFDCVLVGDIFWKSGQNICLWAKKNKKKVFFLQHGQWIYVDDKKSPNHKPYSIMFFGDKVCEMCKKWDLGRQSKCVVTGSPRYDHVEVGLKGEYVYFSPPVIKEMNKSSPSRVRKHPMEELSKIQKINCKDLLIQPHYREGDLLTLKKWFRGATFVDPALDPFPFIAKCKAVLTHRDSTVVLDAIAHGKKTILMNFDGGLRSFYPRFYFGSFATESSNMSDLQRNIDTISGNEIIDEKYVQSARQYVYLGNASERVYNVMVKS